MNHLGGLTGRQMTAVVILTCWRILKGMRDSFSNSINPFVIWEILDINQVDPYPAGHES